ncbi:MAG: hypothetical protein ACNA8W_06065 [Bradymonadaceae bacterium]
MSSNAVASLLKTHGPRLARLKRHSPVPYYQQALLSVREDPWVMGWKIGGDFLNRLLTLTALGFFLVLFVGHFDGYMIEHGNVSSWLDEIRRVVSSKSFITGSTGTIFVGALIAMCLDAFIRGGIWGTLANATMERPVVHWSTFFERGFARFPAMVGFKLLSYAVWLFLVGLATTLVVCLVQVSTVGAFSDLGPLAMGALWGMGGAIFFSVFVLFRLVLAATCAPLFLEDRPLGDAVFHAAVFVLHHTLQLYRLFLIMLAFTLIPLGLYWGVLMLQNLAIWYDTWVGVAAVLRLLGDIVLLASISAVSVLFYGALLAYYNGENMEISVESPDSSDSPPIDEADEKP